MSLKKREQIRTQRRVFRVRGKLKNPSNRLRVSVFRSARHIYAQIIDDNTHATLLSASSLTVNEDHGDKKSVARRVGLELGKVALNNKINDLIFDRGAYLYHGRVKELAEGLREAGINI